MAEYIERSERLLYYISDMAYEQIQRVPAADVRPVVRGKWIKIKYRSICRDCSFRGFASWNFCPNCGADMREES